MKSAYMEIADGEWPAASRASIPRAKASTEHTKVQGHTFNGSPPKQSPDSPPNLNAVVDQHANMSVLPTRPRNAKCMPNSRQ